MLRVPVYSGVLKLKNVNMKGLCWQAKIARHRIAHGKALSCCFCRYAYACACAYAFACACVCARARACAYAHAHLTSVNKA